MAEEKAKEDVRFNYIKDRLVSGYPKLAGAKLDKALTEDANREVIQHFIEDENTRCLVVPDTLKFDSAIPSKLNKGKVLLFIKLHQPSCLQTIYRLI